MNKIVVIAVGGNSLIADKEHQTIPEQSLQAQYTVQHILSLIENGYEVVLTHGNGPQVGFILLRSDYARGIVHTVPLDICVGDTQGSLGYQFQQALINELRKKNIDKDVATIVTQVVVDKDDEAFQKPTKPIGPFYSKEEAEKRKTENGWDMVDDAGRGWRRAVASPKPKEIVEFNVIKKLVKSGTVVIAAGGGGIPVIRDENGDLKGVPAVIDKDNASAMLANWLNAELFIISTNVKNVCLNWGKPDQKEIYKMTLSDAKQYIKEGHFSAGSMLPKMEAAVDFLEGGGREVLITNYENLETAISGQSGTRISR
ncbi:MAG: carbamate kinase [bacterium]